MNPVAREKLCIIVSRYGRGVRDDPRKVQALLADLCPDLKRERHALVAALERGVAGDLLSSSPSVPWPATLGRLARRLTDETAMSEEAARWAVEAWGTAPGRISASQAAGPSETARGAAAKTAPAPQSEPEAPKLKKPEPKPLRRRPSAPPVDKPTPRPTRSSGGGLWGFLNKPLRWGGSAVIFLLIMLIVKVGPKLADDALKHAAEERLHEQAEKEAEDAARKQAVKKAVEDLVTKMHKPQQPEP